MKEKHKNGCNILIMTITNLEKYVYSKHPSLQQSRTYFRAEKVTRLRLIARN